jgi:thiol-disulfide isomerase/thioredoxin
MKKYLLVLLFASFASLFAQDINKVIVDEAKNQELLIGQCNRDGLHAKVFADYFDEGYNSYVPDAEIVKKLKKLKKNVEVVIVMASWCHDSKVQVPHFYKLMDQVGVKDSNISLIAVDRSKTAGDVDVSGLDVVRVPTFIFYKDGREIGRIVESPTSTLDKDTLLIFSMGS